MIGNYQDHSELHDIEEQERAQARAAQLLDQIAYDRKFIDYYVQLDFTLIHNSFINKFRVVLPPQ